MLAFPTIDNELSQACNPLQSFGVPGLSLSLGMIALPTTYPVTIVLDF